MWHKILAACGRTRADQPLERILWPFWINYTRKGARGRLLSIGSTLRAACSADDFAFFTAAENENGDYLPTVAYSTEGERHSGIKVNAIPG